MTLRVVISVDPGQTGAVVVLADGRIDAVIDMPTFPRKAGGNQVDPYRLARDIREVLARHPGAYTLAVIEQVNAMPKQGGTSGFRFGQSDGIVRGALGALGVPMMEVPPSVWKKHLGLTGAEKDAARGMAIQRFPENADQLTRKKDIGRADAMLIAVWAWQTEQVGAHGG